MLVRLEWGGEPKILAAAPDGLNPYFERSSRQCRESCEVNAAANK
jgi:hypothetical protein